MEVVIMTEIHKTNRYLIFGMMFALLLGLLFSGLPGNAHAADGRTFQNKYLDSRYHHNHYYPARGQEIRAVPRGSHMVSHGGSRYYYSGGIWYHPHGGHYTIIMPPIGLFVPFLPPYYATFWIGGIPYYYANEVYYVQRGNGYEVVEPPQGEATQTNPPVGQMFIYPRQGQSEQQQADDRYACHKWAVEQTGFDPTEPPADAAQSPETFAQKRDDYQRAMAACLEGKGYTVK